MGFAVEIEYANDKVQSQCTSVKAALKLFGGNRLLAESLFARINALEAADVIKDIIVQRQFRFHSLENYGKSKLKGMFAIDVKTVRDPWRIILQPLDEKRQPFDPCHIDVIAGFVRIVSVEEISKHYE